MNKFYITTPIYYVNDIPHIGHAYTTIAADVLARYKRLKGFDVYYLTGLDEHGQKIMEAAQAKGVEVQKHVDEMAEGFKKAWNKLEIKNDGFIRTTSEKHKKVVQEFFKKMMEKGDVYKGQYEGWYCIPCESYWTEIHLKDSPKNKDKKKYVCPDCGRPVKKVKEDTYFFKLSKYQDQLLKHFEENPDFLQPVSRKNEVLSFIKQGLKDLSISRTSFTWGVPIPGDDKHVIYVWFDALINYVSALDAFDGKNYKKYWPADVHVMGKEIIRFHAVIWPIMLMSVGVPLPKKVFGHGWWTVEGKKMSKTTGNVVDPIALAEEFGVDPVRYFLLREVPFGVDGDFSRASLIARFNADLANDLGNLLHRTLTMCEKYFKGEIPNPKNHKFDDLSKELVALSEKTIDEVDKSMNALAFSEALSKIWKVIGVANTYIEKEAPWKLAKAGETEKLEAVIFNLLEVLRITAILISPYMPSTGEKMLSELKASDIRELSFGKKLAGKKVAKGQPLFPRLEK
ncbi:MAG: methionine--tRNA ligase [Candidatus Margulisbacteria bacterium]|nr:methionine--tRNA ligase [Candidatus Margulisiibacteriota bacterium]MBU1021999.1 methionine--tRNA ligase [Candidatus Margulisiibacteriota bacterium]MBU1729878.1 methionine--tRNA ligase [Candidatus Margulisiibacteriota bacterium]MBU1955208.1 methionine--tRNA ligase [Candidatus Margulisiibacteriota bacterium]